MATNRTLAILSILLSAAAFGQEPKPLDDPHFDKAMFEAFAASIDLTFACSLSFDGITERDPVKVPPELEKRLKTTKDQANTLKGIRSADKIRDHVRIGFAEYLDASANATETLINALKLGFSNKKWTSDAKELVAKFSKQRMAVEEMIGIADFYTFTRGSSEFRNRCPDNLAIYIGISFDKTGFPLGINNYTDENNTVMTFVDKNYIAYALGFRAGDILKSFNEKPINDILQFKEQLKDLQGKKATAIVVRGGKDFVINMDVPVDIAHYDSDPKATKMAADFVQNLVDGKKIDRSMLTENCLRTLPPDEEESLSKQMHEAGTVELFKFVGFEYHDKILMRAYEIRLGKQHLLMNFFTTSDGKLDQLILGAFPGGI